MTTPIVKSLIDEEIDLLECVIGPGQKNYAGYSIATYKSKSVGHHRLSYCQHNGIAMEDIKGKVVMHKCDNPPCINPDHLMLGTVADNNRDRARKGRSSKTRPSIRKLTQAQAEEIRRRHASKTGRYDSKNSTRGLAAEFGVTQKAIMLLLQGVTYQVDPEMSQRKAINAENRKSPDLTIIAFGLPFNEVIGRERGFLVADLPVQLAATMKGRRIAVRERRV